MAADKRTRAELLEALREAEAQNRLRVKALEDRLERQLPEARAIDMCVTALRALAESTRSSSSSGNYGGRNYGVAEAAVGNVLHYLARRFGAADQSDQVERLVREANDLRAENERLRYRLNGFTELANTPVHTARSFDMGLLS